VSCITFFIPLGHVSLFRCCIIVFIPLGHVSLLSLLGGASRGGDDP
jgi:hypothetical protein